MLMLQSPVQLAAQPSQPGQRVNALKSLSLEELASLDVTTAGRRLERASDVAAAVSVVSAEDMRRSGVTSLPELLRLADGLQVARLDGRTWGVSARGFNLSTSNKMLVMMDGRSLWTPLFSGVLWDEHDMLFADVDRIEVVRGPGGTLWGANAINGIVNIVSAPATDTIGTYASVSAGSEDRLVASLRHGRAMGTAGAWRAFAKVSLLDGQRFANGDDAQDDQRRVLVGGRMDWKSGRDNFELQSDGYFGKLGLFDRDDIDLHGAYVRGAWTRAMTDTSEISVQAVGDYSSRFVPLQFEEKRASAEIDANYRLRRGRHDILMGGDVEITRDRTEPSAVLSFTPDDRTLSLYSLYVQDELQLVSGRVWITPGIRFLKNSYTGIETLPALRVRFRPAASQTLWAAASRAVRLPSRIDRDLRFRGDSPFTLVAGSDDFDSERVISIEGGYRVQASRRVSFDASVFSSDYNSLRSQAPGGAVALAVLSNDLNGKAKGLELSLKVQALSWMRVHGSYTRLSTSTSVDAGRVDLGGGMTEFNDPQHQYGARVYTDLPRGFEADAFYRHVSTLPHPAVPSYSELDARFGWMSSAGHELAIIGRNLLHERHPEFGPAGIRRYEFERAVGLRSTWRF